MQSSSVEEDSFLRFRPCVRPLAFNPVDGSQLPSVQLGKHLAEHDADRRLWHSQFAGLHRFEPRRGIAVSQPRFGIDDPDVLDAEAKIAFKLILHTAQGIFGRENLNGDQRRMREIAVDHFPCPYHKDVRHPEIGGRNLGAQFGKDFYAPFRAFQHKKKGEIPLDEGMLYLSQIPLLYPPIHILAVRAPSRGEVFPHGPEVFRIGHSRHAPIIAPGNPSPPQESWWLAPISAPKFASALRYCFVMPIEDLQQAAQKIAAFLTTLNKLGGFRLKFRITAGDGARDPEGIEARQIYVELAGPDTPLVVQHNGELLRALETLAAQMLRLDQREYDLVSFDAANFKALHAQELRLTAETAAEKVRKSGIPYAFAPMNSRERRLLHLAFRSVPGVETASSGEGQDRFLVVYPQGKTDLPFTPPTKPRGFTRR